MTETELYRTLFGLSDLILVFILGLSLFCFYKPILNLIREAKKTGNSDELEYYEPLWQVILMCLISGSLIIYAVFRFVSEIGSILEVIFNL